MLDIAWVKRTVNRKLAKCHGYYLQHAKETCLVGIKVIDSLLEEELLISFCREICRNQLRKMFLAVMLSFLNVVDKVRNQMSCTNLLKESFHPGDTWKYLDDDTIYAPNGQLLAMKCKNKV